MHVTYPPRGHAADLARYARWEYGGGAAYIRAMIAPAGRVRPVTKRGNVGRLVLRVLAKIPEALAAVATPGGA